MIRVNRYGSWLISVVLVVLVFSQFWTNCSQRNPTDPTSSVEEEVLSLTGIVANPSKIAVGGAQAEIQVKLVDKSNVPIPNKVVYFSTDLGTVTSQDSTDANGYAYAQLTSGQSAGQATVTARYGNYTSTEIFITFISSSQTYLQIESEERELLANGIDQTRITVTVMGDSAEPTPGAYVTLSATVGDIQPALITDSNGKGEVYVTSCASSGDSTATITATYDTSFVALMVQFKGVQISTAASPTAIKADGSSTSTITVLLKESVSQIAITDARINFGSNIGTVPYEAVTNTEGIAEVLLKSGTEPDTARVVAFYGNLFTDTVNIEFTSEEPRPNILTDLSAAPSVILANGIDQSIISVTVLDADSNPVENQLLSFCTSFGLIPSQAVTDQNGVASVSLISSASHTNLTNWVTVRMDTITEYISVLFEGVDIQLGALPTVVLADGQSTSQITAILKKTATQIAISDAAIIFATDLGTIPNQATTTSQGIAQVNYVSATDTGTAHIVARYGSTITDTVEVTCSLETYGSNTLSELSVSPDAILANGIDQSTVSVMVLDPQSNPVQGSIVVFSTTAGSLYSQAVTNGNGVASVQLTSIASHSDTTAIVTVSLNTVFLSTQVFFEGIDLSLGALPGTIFADGQSTSQITAILKKTTSKIAISNASVSFGADLGTIPNQATTNSQGVAQVSYVCGTDTGTAHITVIYGDVLRDSVEVYLQESVPTYLEVTAIPISIPADGQSQSTIKATVTDANRNHVPDGTTVLFDIIEGSGSIGHQRTTVAGVATSMLTSSTAPDTARIVVSVGISLSDTVTVAYAVGGVDRIEITAEPDSLPADGVTKSTIRTSVYDTQDNPVEGVTIEFSATFGDIVSSARTGPEGAAEVEYSSTVVGLATITASVGEVSRTTTVKVNAGPSFSMTVTYDPHFMYVRDCGKNQTVTIFADVRDEKNNPVKDGTCVTFSIDASPGQGDFLSSVDPKPTVGGVAQVSYSSGMRSGTARIRAVVTDGGGIPVSPEVSGVSSEIVIYSGPPYIEDINNQLSTHLTVVSNRLNIWTGEDTTMVSALVGDRYNNPVQEGTAVYFTTSGGVITTQAYTDENGIAKAILIGGNPRPTIDRYYNYEGLTDPNTGSVIPGPIPDFEGQQVENTEGDSLENDGIARIIVHTEGIDSLGNSAKAWDWSQVVMSSAISKFEIEASGDTLSPGGFATISIELWDVNGNPVVGVSSLTTGFAPSSASAELSWTEKITGDPGTCFFAVNLFNTIKPSDPDAQPGWVSVTISIQSVNGNYERTVAIYLDLI